MKLINIISLKFVVANTFLLFVNFSFAASIFVSTTGSDRANGSDASPYKTIAKAASVVNAGDTVFVEGGHYVESSITPKSSGTVNAMIVFKPKSNTGDVVIQHSGTTAGDNTPVFQLSNRSYICIEGFQFRDFQFAKASILISNGNWNVVRNNRFINLGNSGSASWDANSVVWVYRSSHNTFQNNYFENIIGDGISINGQTAMNNLILANSFKTFKGKIRSWGGVYLFSRAIDIQDVTNGNNLVALNHAIGVINHIWLDRDGSNNVIIRNTAHNSVGIVFNESRCAFNIVQENIAYNTSSPAFQTARYETTGWTFDARWVNNVAYNCKVGYYIDMSERDEFRNNITFNSVDNNLVFTAKAADKGPHVFANNLWFKANSANSILLRNKATTVSVFQAAMNETGGLSVNPMFVSTTIGAENFELQQNSPARRAGAMNVDMGAYAVYGPVPVGFSSNYQLFDCDVYFQQIMVASDRNMTNTYQIRLTKPAVSTLVFEVVPFAGEAVADIDFSIENPTITFNAGESIKTLTINTLGRAQYNNVVAFKLNQLSGQMVACRNIMLMKINMTPDFTRNDETYRTRNDDFGFTILPNPAVNKLLIEHPLMVRISIVNSSGQIMYESQSNTDRTAVDVSAYSAGVYFVKLNDGKRWVVQKLIKK